MALISITEKRKQSIQWLNLLRINVEHNNLISLFTFTIGEEVYASSLKVVQGWLNVSWSLISIYIIRLDCLHLPGKCLFCWDWKLSLDFFKYLFVWDNIGKSLNLLLQTLFEINECNHYLHTLLTYKAHLNQ